MSRSRTKRVSKANWLDEALETLERDGVAGVRVERLARALGVAKAGFYWHFRDRDDLLGQMLDHWSQVYTRTVTDDADVQAAPPEERLRRIMHLILDRDLTRYDLSMRAWAGHDPLVARRVRRVYALREEFVRRAFAELGFRGDELEMRTRLFLCYHSWERPMFWRETKAELRRLIDRRLALLLKR